MDLPRSMLGVWAHPDDESFLASGLMAMTVRDGGRVVCVTATRGEEGVVDEQKWPKATLAKVRELELLRSLEILGVTEHRWLDYLDGQCPTVDPEEAIERVSAVIEEVEPDAVFTFGPDGMTGHPDHRAISAWTTEAFQRSAPAGSRLYHAALTQEFADNFVPIFNRFNVFPKGVVVVSDQDLEIVFRCPPEILDLKFAALQAHASQVEHMIGEIGVDIVRDSVAQEAYRLAGQK